MNNNSLDVQREFLAKEVEFVRASHDSFIEETRRLERYSILVTGLTWSWCASNTANYAFNLLIWFPAVACVLFGLRAWAMHWRSRAARTYLALIEREFGLQSGFGWASTEMHSKGIAALAAASAYLFWAVVNVGTVIVPLVYLQHLR